MSQNENKAGSAFGCTVAAHLSLKLSDVESFSMPFPKRSSKIAYSGKLISTRLLNWDEFQSQSLKADASIAALYCLHWLTEENWMKSVLESIRTPADAVAVFRSIQARVSFYKDNEAGVSVALLPFCQKLLDSNILVLLGQVPGLPKDILSITTRFLVASRQLSSPSRVLLIDSLLRKNMLIDYLPNTITEGSIRGFVWNESNQKKRTKNMPAEANPVKSWTAQSYVKTEEVTPGKHVPMGKSVELDGNGGLITITKFVLPSAGDLESFAWEVCSAKAGVSGRIYAYGFASTLEEAAEASYVGFFKAVTFLACQEANEYMAGKEIVLIGNELTSEEFIKGAGKNKNYYFLVQMPPSEDRDGTLFCLNWHTINKVKRTFKITKVNGKKLTLEGGTVIDVDTVQCYIKCPEQYVETEVRCSKCGQLGFPNAAGGRFIQGVGYQCGPSLDNSVELGELSDSQFD